LPARGKLALLLWFCGEPPRIISKLFTPLAQREISSAAVLQREAPAELMVKSKTGKRQKSQFKYNLKAFYLYMEKEFCN